MFKIILFICGVTLVTGIKIKSQLNPITLKNNELFKYSPNDKYTLPEDIDEDNKPAVQFSGEVKQAQVVKLENFNQGQGKYKLNLQTQNGIQVTQVGKLKDDKTFVVSGSYSYTGADGKKYRVRYTADELGYHPITELDVDSPEIIVPQAAAKQQQQASKFQFLNKQIKNIETTAPSSSKDNGYAYTVGNGVSTVSDFGNNKFGGNAFGGQGGNAFGSQAGSGFGSQAGNGFGSQAGSGFGSQAGNRFGSQTGNGFGSQTGSPFGGQGGLGSSGNKFGGTGNAFGGNKFGSSSGSKATYEDHSDSGYEYVQPSREYLPTSGGEKSFRFGY